LRLIIGMQPTFKKTPEIFEMGYEGTDARELLGKELKIDEVLKAGEVVDVIGITKGKGFEGVIKKYGAKLLHHKSEKKRRKQGSVSPWHPAKVTFRALMPGKVGFHQRTEFNKWVLKIGKPEEVNPRGGFVNFGPVKSDYVMLRGSVPGPKKRLVIMRKAIRKNNLPSVPPEISHISLKSKQGVGA
jgi:large subunit ribosomal protein L3